MKTTHNLTAKMVEALTLLAETCAQGHAGSLEALKRRGLVKLTYSGGVTPYSHKYHGGMTPLRSPRPVSPSATPAGSTSTSGGSEKNDRPPDLFS